MSARRTRHWLRRIHVWLGWLVGIPLLIWTASGLFMAAQPIEKVRGEALLAEAPSLKPATPPVPPAIGPRPVASLLLEQRGDGARWIIKYSDGGARLADPATGRLLPGLTAADAARLAADRRRPGPGGPRPAGARRAGRPARRRRAAAHPARGRAAGGREPDHRRVPAARVDQRAAAAPARAVRISIRAPQCWASSF